MADDPRYSLSKGLVRIHLVISRGVDVARERSRAYANGEPVDPTRAAGLADYLQALASILHAHHTGEEEIFFTALRGRFPDAPWDLLAEEHRSIVPVLAELEAGAAQVRQQPSRGTWAALADSLDRLAALWGPHYQREEAQFSPPVVAGVVAGDEQVALTAKIVAHSQQHAGPDYLVVPFLLYNLSGGERVEMGAQFPPVVTEQLVPIVWRDKWASMKPFLFA